MENSVLTGGSTYLVLGLFVPLMISTRYLPLLLNDSERNECNGVGTITLPCVSLSQTPIERFSIKDIRIRALTLPTNNNRLL